MDSRVFLFKEGRKYAFKSKNARSRRWMPSLFSEREAVGILFSKKVHINHNGGLTFD